MERIVAINGSARLKKGFTEMFLQMFLAGAQDAGAEVELFYASQLDVKPCIGDFQCWFEKPGVCVHEDEMGRLLAAIRAADVLVLGMPVYIPLPGAMQNILNRMCPLFAPELEFRDGRTRAQLHRDVSLRQLVLVSVSGWWEVGNMDTVVRIARELAADMSVEFAGALLRPHAQVMEDAELGDPKVLEAAREAGRQLVSEGRMDPATLAEASRPLIAEEELRRRQNEAWTKALDSPRGLW